MNYSIDILEFFKDFLLFEFKNYSIILSLLSQLK